MTSNNGDAAKTNQLVFLRSKNFVVLFMKKGTNDAKIADYLVFMYEITFTQNTKL